MKRSALLFLISAGSASLLMAGDGNYGTHAGSFLATQTGVRSSGMGSAAVAIMDDVDSIYNNPAGLATLQRIELSALHADLQKETDHQNFIAAFPLKAGTSTNVKSLGTIAAAFGQINYGDFSGRDAAGSPTPDFDAHDYYWSLGYAKGWFNQLFLGVVIKRYQLKIANEREQGEAFDLGLLYKMSPKWNIGMAVKNQGSQLRFVQVDEKLPQTTTVGIAYFPFNESLTLAFDFEKVSAEKSRTKSGIEWWANRTVALRGGYDNSGGVGGNFTIGAGLRILDLEAAWYPVQRLSIDYSYVLASTVSGVDGYVSPSRQNVSLSMRFGAR